MILDGHIHIRFLEGEKEEFYERLAEAGIDGGIVISRPPAAFPPVGPSGPPNERIQDVQAWAAGHEYLYPFYWIDPLEEDAGDQVALAVEKGIMGFKIICDRYFPGDERAMKVFQAIAAAGKPILFHSGILWDGKASSPFNRPAAFEALLEIDNLKFSLAHISWPWTDELIAVYGKFQNTYTRRPEVSVEMFIDLTPGTPPIYRKEALTRLFTVGYDVEHNIIFGLDSTVSNFNVNWAEEWIERDNGIYEELGLAEEVRKDIYAENLKRFVGINNDPVKKKRLEAAE